MAEEVASDKPKPTSTLHYLIVYPSLLLALGGSVPTVLNYIKAWRLDTTAATVALVEEQNVLWARNLACIGESSSWEVDTPNGHPVTAKITVCPHTGDILVRYFQNDAPPQYRWLRRPEPVSRKEKR